MTSGWTTWSEDNQTFTHQPQPQSVTFDSQFHAYRHESCDNFDLGIALETLGGLHAQATDECELNQQFERPSSEGRYPLFSSQLGSSRISHSVFHPENRTMTHMATSMHSAEFGSGSNDSENYRFSTVPYGHASAFHAADMASPAPATNDATYNLYSSSQPLYINTATAGVALISSPSTIGSSGDEDASIAAGTPSSPAFDFSQTIVEDVEKEFENFRFHLSITPHIRDGFMPQRMYRSHSKADHHRYIKDANLQPTIVFYPKHFEHIGIALRDILSNSAKIEELLADADELVLSHGPPSTSIRLQVPGYASKKIQKRQISLRSQKNTQRHLTKGRFLRLVANAIDVILRKLTHEQQESRPVAHLPVKWTIGNGPGQISTKDLYIVSIHNVSKGTWQPQLYLDPQHLLAPRTQ